MPGRFVCSKSSASSASRRCKARLAICSPTGFARECALLSRAVGVVAAVFAGDSLRGRSAGLAAPSRAAAGAGHDDHARARIGRRQPCLPPEGSVHADAHRSIGGHARAEPRHQSGSRAHPGRHAHVAAQSGVRLRSRARRRVLHDDPGRLAESDRYRGGALRTRRHGDLPAGLRERRRSSPAPRTAARTRRTGEASGIWSGRGIPTRATPPTSSTMRSCFGKRTATCKRSTIATSKACSRARRG